jgi:hypothetical protein
MKMQMSLDEEREPMLNAACESSIGANGVAALRPRPVGPTRPKGLRVFPIRRSFPQDGRRTVDIFGRNFRLNIPPVPGGGEADYSADLNGAR